MLLQRTLGYIYLLGIVKMEKTNEKRMYVLVPYNLSDIQKGIQGAHAIAEYSLEFSSTFFEGQEYYMKNSKYVDWVNNWKTIIILNGGTTNNDGSGSLQNYIKDIRKLGVTCATFQEPDLNNATTAVAFVLDMVEDAHVVGYLKQMGLA